MRKLRSRLSHRDSCGTVPCNDLLQGWYNLESQLLEEVSGVGVLVLLLEEGLNLLLDLLALALLKSIRSNG